ncbi:DUF3667 domain-containing protein [Seonamhaeicola maritimus]|uniref:DUF3667 domain-containing protein n=1 Tax=Seonamhaeicola maritimus TaxID=2591822 RepID=A0A5C7GER0_9FLAO|nr:DUF3667 domain-containing protein [Seonamhaeicola maritimus]TXG35106.1 DUF3667 domain-containing protein [Seonamhaeicola maritimus]
MNCRNCNTSLRTDYSFCPDCGAKVIRNRISVKNLLYDLIERYFNLDNTFLKTLWHMLIKPHIVCGGYIAGIRKKYLNPVSMLAIALTSSGFILFLIKKVAWDSIDFSSISYAQTSTGGSGTEKIISATMEYSSLIYFLYIPMIAFAGFVVFNKKQYNYAEHFVTAIYALTSFSIISTVYQAILLLVNPQVYIDTALIYVALMIFFCVYVSYKNSKFSKTSLLWRVPTFLLIFFMDYLGISMLSIVMLFLTGDISIQDFVPKN